jgi:hypothetical protein
VISWNVCSPEKVSSLILTLRYYVIEAVHFRNQKQRRLLVDSSEADNTGGEETNAGSSKDLGPVVWIREVPYQGSADFKRLVLHSKRQYAVEAVQAVF